MLKHLGSMGLFSSKIYLIVQRLIEIRYGMVLKTHSLLKNKDEDQELVDHIFLYSISIS
jgi:hypothetical protein